MTGLPKIPGYEFTDPAKQKFNLCQTFRIINGIRIPRNNFAGIGHSERDVASVNYIHRLETMNYDPSLTYGRSRTLAPPQFLPQYALYDKKCLTFQAFFKQAVFESPLEHCRVRHVNIIYFLEDDTITLIEPKTLNSGLQQGRLVKRAKIPSNSDGRFLHWKDLNVGKEICIYGVVYNIVDCDKFTEEYLSSQGVELGKRENMPPDQYTQSRYFSNQINTFYKTPSTDDKFHRFLEYDGKILKFKALWDDDSEYGERRPYNLYYFLADDSVSVKEDLTDMEGRDPFPVLLRKTKLPKIWTQRPENYPSIYLELSENEVTEYYQPKDFRIGETIFVLGRRMLLYDCDSFTRNYFSKVFNYEQPPKMDISIPPAPEIKPPMPPHNSFGSLEDSLENTRRIMPKRPKKDVIKQVLDANKFLRYTMKFDVVHPEDEIRRFTLNYNLGDGTCKIYEPPIRNSGILGGKYLSSQYLIKPGSDPVDPDYYTPIDFYIGAVITVYEQRFVVVGADLCVYRYMQKNQEKFPCEVIENMRNYMFQQGLLEEDLQEQVDEEHEKEKKAKRDAIGRDLEKTSTEMEKCIEAAHTASKAFDPDEERSKREKVIEEYEKTYEHVKKVPPQGIQSTNLVCPYSVHIGEVKPVVCTDLGEYSEFTPKHIDTPEEALQKHYDAILKRHQSICEKGKLPECKIQPPLGLDSQQIQNKEAMETKLMMQPLEIPKGACRIKSVNFADGPPRCEREAFDVCDMRTKKSPCDCTNYFQKCHSND